MTVGSGSSAPRSALASVIPACALVTLATCDSTTSGNPDNPDAPEVPNVELVADVVATGLDTVWELVWGPDGFIWMTERGGRISRVNPQTGAVTPVGQVAVSEIGEGGLMGLALHPDFATQPWVYVAHTYQQGGVEEPGHPDAVRRQLTRRTRGPARRHPGLEHP